jgi:hypothetical protein
MMVKLPHEHFGGQLRFGLESRVMGQLAFFATPQIFVGEPFPGDEQSLVDQRVTGKDAHLAGVDFAYRSAVLFGDANGILALFDKTAFIEDQSTVRASKIIVNVTTKLVHDFIIAPWCIADKPLHGPGIAAFNGKGYRLDGFAFKGAELTGHVFKKVLSGFTTQKTISELIVKAEEAAIETVYQAPLNSRDQFGRIAQMLPTLHRTLFHRVHGPYGLGRSG